jgi:dipeptidase E
MKAILCSSQVIPERVKNDLHIYGGRDAHVVFLPLASATHTKKKHFAQIKSYYGHELGIENIDYFDFSRKASANAYHTLEKHTIYHFSGGNPIKAVLNLRESGGYDFFRNLADRDKVFVGNSGGSVLLSNNASWFQLRTEEVSSVIRRRAEYQALELAGFEFLLHYDRFRKKKDFFRRLLQYSKRAENPIYACNDGDGIVVENGEVRFFGEVVEIRKGTVRRL